MIRKTKGNPSQAEKNNETSIEERSVEGVVSYLKGDPKFTGLTDDQLTIVVQTSMEVTENLSFSSSLPPPAIFESYEKTLPGSADRLLKMAEKNAENRICMEKDLIESDVKRSDRGQMLGFILSALFICSSVLCAYFKQPFTATVLGVGGFSSIISIFVLGKR